VPKDIPGAELAVRVSGADPSQSGAR